MNSSAVTALHVPGPRSPEQTATHDPGLQAPTPLYSPPRRTGWSTSHLASPSERTGRLLDRSPRAAGPPAADDDPVPDPASGWRRPAGAFAPSAGPFEGHSPTARGWFW